MKIINSPLQGCYLIKENVIDDNRGHFLETYNYNYLKEKINVDQFIQENESFSRKKVIRGMHYQQEPYSQNKIIRVLSGKIWDIVIDLRPDSSSYLNSYGVELSQENGEQLFVPSGFAHGFRCYIGLCKSTLQSKQTLCAPIRERYLTFRSTI